MKHLEGETSGRRQDEYAPPLCDWPERYPWNRGTGFRGKGSAFQKQGSDRADETRPVEPGLPILWYSFLVDTMESQPDLYTAFLDLLRPWIDRDPEFKRRLEMEAADGKPLIFGQGHEALAADFMVQHSVKPEFWKTLHQQDAELLERLVETMRYYFYDFATRTRQLTAHTPQGRENLSRANAIRELVERIRTEYRKE